VAATNLVPISVRCRALSDVGRALASGAELRASLERALEKRESIAVIVRGAVFLLDEAAAATSAWKRRWASPPKA